MTPRRRPLTVAAAGLAAAALVLGACAPDQPTGATEPAGVEPATGDSVQPQQASSGEHAEAALTVHPLATRAAMDVLADGGTAADAAVASAAVLSVVEPYFSNIIAGETSALYLDAEDGEMESLESVGHVGADYDPADYERRGATGFGLYQALVPGAWDGWMELLAEHGELGLDRLLQPAIELARDGHTLDTDFADRLAGAVETESVNEAAAAIYAPDGEPLQEGDTVVQADFAATLQTITDSYLAAGDREDGLEAARDVVYEGAIGEGILDAVRADGGYLTPEDLAEFESSTSDPVSLDWDEEVTLHQNPPPSQGLAMVAALNTLRGADLSAGPDDPATVHLQVEAMKLAMADREAYVGDPDFTEAPVSDLTSPEHGEAQLARIDPDTSLEWPIEAGLETMDNTTTFQIVDAEGNAAAVTTSIGYQFQVAGETGVLMNNRMRFMTADDPDSPNFIEAGKQVRYTGNPWIATRDGAPWLLGGVIGADTQPQVQTQHFLNMVAWDMTPEEAVAHPRFVTQHSPNSVAPHEAPNVLKLEETYAQDVMDGLRASGQQVEVGPESSDFGYGTIMELSPDGTEVSLGPDARIPTSTGDVREP